MVRARRGPEMRTGDTNMTIIAFPGGADPNQPVTIAAAAARLHVMQELAEGLEDEAVSAFAANEEQIIQHLALLPAQDLDGLVRKMLVTLGKIQDAGALDLVTPATGLLFVSVVRDAQRLGGMSSPSA